MKPETERLELLALEIERTMEVHTGEVQVRSDHLALFINCGCHEPLFSDSEEINARLLGILHKHSAYLSTVNAEWGHIYLE